MRRLSVSTRLKLLILLLLLSGAPAASCFGQLPKVADSRLGVDVVRLMTGQRLYGFVLTKEVSGDLQVAVERKWLSDTYPDLFDEQVEKEELARQTAKRNLIQRIEDWRDERQTDEDEVLIGFLESELARIANRPTEAAKDKQFMLLSISAASIREVTIQNIEPRKIAGLAYQHGLDKVVVTPASLLKKRLLDQEIDLAQEQVDLSDQVPLAASQSSRQWAARRALVEFQMREKLEYQGTGNTMIRKGESVDATSLMGQLLGGGGMDAVSQLGAELGLPEFQQFKKKRKDWWQAPTREAERDGFTGVLLTRLQQDMLTPNVTVESHFYAMESPGNWFPVFQLRTSANANSQPADRVDRLKDDPQIKQVIDSLSALGLPVGDRIDQALRHGAATHQALQEVNSEFYLLLGNNTRALDGPPIPLAVP